MYYIGFIFGFVQHIYNIRKLKENFKLQEKRRILIYSKYQ